MITLNGVEKSHGCRTLFSHVPLQLNCGDRLCSVDPNATGKTTLFNLFLGKESTDKGSVNMERKLGLGILPRRFTARSSWPRWRRKH